jgi:polyphosphate kinase
MLLNIDRIMKQAKRGVSSSIIIKLNSLVDKALIDKLYLAAKYGVKVQMVIRGICCAYTEHKSFKGSISAISIIDDYLEHARIFQFGSGASLRMFISSADWMVRNLDHRIEAACPIFDKEIQEELQEILRIQLAENVKGRILDNEQSNHYVPRENDQKPVRSQEAIYNYLRNKKYE